MATDVERLAILIESNTKSYERAMVKIQQQTDRAASKMEKRFRDAGKRLDSTFAGITGGLGRAAGILGVTFGVRELQRFADGFANIQNALRVTGLEGESLNRVYDKLFDSAQRNAVPLSALATLYSRVAIVQKELGISTEQATTFTDHIAVALRVSGQSAEQSAGALLQLAQALGSGTVRAEEFNSILEGALPIAQAAAAGLTEAGGSVAKLRTLVIAGKVSSQAFFNAFEAGSVMLEQRAGSMQTTIGQAATRLGNVMIDAIGRIAQTTGASDEVIRFLNDMANGIKFVADNIDAAMAPFREFIQFLEDVNNKITAAARAFGKFTGLANVGPALGLGAGGLLDTTEDGGSKITVNAKPPPPPIKPVSLKDFAPPSGKKTGSGAGANEFERDLKNLREHIALMEADADSIDMSTYSRERLMVATKLVTAIQEQNAKAGKKDAEITDEQREKIDQISDAYARMAVKLEDAKGPLRSFARESANVKVQMEDALVNGLKGFEDALIGVIQGTKDAKEAFRDMANAIIADLLRIMIRSQITAPLASMFSSFIPSLFGGFKAAGGPVAAGRSYIVGERGPEMFVPDGAGRIVPNAAMGGGNQRPIQIKIEQGPGTKVTAGRGRGDGGVDVIQIVTENVLAELAGPKGQKMQRAGYNLQPALRNR